uniref:Uncharacterized protein n=1 Tax=Rhinolophus ferrumequinum TaxID=59479 RepID=A0A671FZS3_RHIFE
MREAPPTGGTPRNGLGPGAEPGTAVELPVQLRGGRLRGRGLARGCGSVLQVCGAAGLLVFNFLLTNATSVNGLIMSTSANL